MFRLSYFFIGNIVPRHAPMDGQHAFTVKIALSWKVMKTFLKVGSREQAWSNYYFGAVMKDAQRSFIFGSHPIFDEPVAEGAKAYAEELGGFEFDSIGLLQGLLEQFLFNIGQVLIEADALG